MAALKLVSLLALAATILPSVLFLTQTVNHETVLWVAIISTIVWFVATPLWMGSELRPDLDQVEI